MVNIREKYGKKKKALNVPMKITNVDGFGVSTFFSRHTLPSITGYKNNGQITQKLSIFLKKSAEGKGFSGGSAVKNPPANAAQACSIPGWGRSPGEGSGKPLQHFCLENPMERGSHEGYSPWGHRRVGHNLATKQQQ